MHKKEDSEEIGLPGICESSTDTLYKKVEAVPITLHRKI